MKRISGLILIIILGIGSAYGMNTTAKVHASVRSNFSPSPIDINPHQTITCHLPGNFYIQDGELTVEFTSTNFAESGNTVYRTMGKNPERQQSQMIFRPSAHLSRRAVKTINIDMAVSASLNFRVRRHGIPPKASVSSILICNYVPSRS